MQCVYSLGKAALKNVEWWRLKFQSLESSSLHLMSDSIDFWNNFPNFLLEHRHNSCDMIWKHSRATKNWITNGFQLLRLRLLHNRMVTCFMWSFYDFATCSERMCLSLALTKWFLFIKFHIQCNEKRVEAF